MTPFVSVVIPTANRPQFLPRAVESAVAGMPPGEVEVIVVPNGPDESWKDSLRRFDKNPSVRVIHVVEANANVARNTGLANARGRCVRFLDDDDYLYPAAAAEQYRMLEDMEVDVVSGDVELVDIRGRLREVWRQPDKEDFCVAVLGPWRACATTAHVYRRRSLIGAEWGSDVRLLQDARFLVGLCARNDLAWARTGFAVGAWVQHRQQRISTATMEGHPPLFRVPPLFKKRGALAAEMLITAYTRLLASHRLSQERTNAIAMGLWDFVHASFFLDPRYWTRIARLAAELDPSARPLQPLYEWPLFRNLDPVTVQWLLLPKRRVMYTLRYWRRLYRV